MPRPLSGADTIKGWEHVSASAMTTLFFCEQKYAYRYAHKLPEVKSGFLSLGTAIDDAAEAFNRMKLAKHENAMPSKEVVEIAVAGLEKLKDETAWDPDDPMSLMKDQIPGMVGELYKLSLSVVQPAAVQEELKVEFDGFHLLGFNDVRGEDGITRDYKTAKKSWSKGKENQEVQPVIYTMNDFGESKFAWDIMVRTKELKLQQPTRTVKPSEKAGMKKLANAAKTRMDQLRLDPERAMPTGYGGWLCSTKLCPFWEACFAKWQLPIKGDSE